MAHWRSSLLVALVWALAYLPGLFTPEFKGEEPRRAIIAHEMIQSGDWLQPRLAGEDYEAKPPLFNWLIAVSWRVFGHENEGLARLPSALAMLALALAALPLMRSLVDNQTGLFTALMILVNPGCWEKGRMAEIEALNTALYGVALLLWLFASRRSGWLRVSALLGCGVLLGLAILAKGPLPLLWFALIFPLVAVIHERRWKRVLHCEWLLVVLPMLAVALPWYWWRLGLAWPPESGGSPLAATAEESGALAIWTHELKQRLLPGEGWNPLDPIVVFIEGLLNFMPWTLLLLPMLVPAVRRRLHLGVQRERFASAWSLALILAFVPISLLPGGNGRYTMPLSVPAAVLVAIVYCAPPVWQRLGQTRLIWIRTLEVLRWVAAVALVVLFLASLLLVPERIGWQFFWWLLGAVVLALAWQLIGRLRESVRWTPLATATSLIFVAVVCGYASSLGTVARGREDLRRTAAQVDAERSVPDQVWLYRFKFKGDEGWLHYLNGERRYLPERRFEPADLSGGEVELITSEERWKKDRDSLVERLGEPTEVRRFRHADPGRAPRPWVLLSFDPSPSPLAHRTWASLAREHQQAAWLPPSEGSLRDMLQRAEALGEDEAGAESDAGGEE